MPRKPRKLTGVVVANGDSAGRIGEATLALYREAITGSADSLDATVTITRRELGADEPADHFKVGARWTLTLEPES